MTCAICSASCTVNTSKALPIVFYKQYQLSIDLEHYKLRKERVSIHFVSCIPEQRPCCRADTFAGPMDGHLPAGIEASYVQHPRTCLISTKSRNCKRWHTFSLSSKSSYRRTNTFPFLMCSNQYLWKSTHTMASLTMNSFHIL